MKEARQTFRNFAYLDLNMATSRLLVWFITQSNDSYHNFCMTRLVSHRSVAWNVTQHQRHLKSQSFQTENTCVTNHKCFSRQRWRTIRSFGLLRDTLTFPTRTASHKKSILRIHKPTWDYGDCILGTTLLASNL